MKIKNTHLVIAMLSLIFFAQEAQTRDEQPTRKTHDLKEAPSISSLEKRDKTFDSVMQEETPLQFSTARIKDLFKRNSIPTLELYGRSRAALAKTTEFNKALSNYIKEVFNKEGYAQTLSQDGSHIVELLELAKDLNLDTLMIYTCLRLFYNKIKSWEVIDDTVILQTLDPMPRILESHIKPDDQVNTLSDLSFIKKLSEDMIMAKFSENFNFFETQPKQFISDLSTELSQAVEREMVKVKQTVDIKKDETEMRNRLKQLVVKFYEIALNKTIWNLYSFESIWASFMSIANGLELLVVHRIINHMDDIDDLLWSLVHRFCFFLDLQGGTLPPQFFQEVETDLVNGVVDFLEEPELDDAIKSKKEFLIDALINAKARAMAQNQSLFDLAANFAPSGTEHPETQPNLVSLVPADQYSGPINVSSFE
ncbi:MAG: hypothetical protein ABH827_05845 [bacterium]